MKIRNPKYEIRNGRLETQHVIARNSLSRFIGEAISLYHTDCHGRTSLAMTLGSLRFLFFSFFLFSTLSGCGVYSFTGASISPEVKSVSIDFFPSYAPLAPASVPQTFTEALRDLFVNRTNLDLLTKNGDIQFEGYISSYQTRPVAIQGNETAAQNRLTINVNVTYTDTKDEAKSFEKNFSRFADFDASQNLIDVEQSLIDEINEQLILDIFNEAVVNW